MELNYDWRNFQSLFQNHQKRGITPASNTAPPVYLVKDGQTIVAAYSEGENLSDWIGATYDEMVAEYAHREIAFFERSKVDQWLGSLSDFSHYHDQVQFLRSKAGAEVAIPPLHFLLEAVQTWWQKVLPSHYGLYIQLDGPQGDSLLLTFKRGKLESFQDPDLSSLTPDRLKVGADIVKFLSERYLIPIQGFFITSEEWLEWSTTAHPWPKIIATIKSNRNKLAPFHLGLVSLIAGRGYLGI